MRLSSMPVITLSGFALLLSVVATPAQAATTLTVTGAGEAATLTTNDCSGTQCMTLRGAINAAASGDTIAFAAALDGQTINLTLSSNDLSAGSTEFGPSAFFITGAKTLTIDATANGLTQGVTIARSGAGGTASFRLFDVGSGNSLILRGLTLSNGLAQGGGGALSQGGGGALGAGGAIFNQGTLSLQQCTLAGNVAQGGSEAGPANISGGGVGQTSSSTTGGGPNGGAAGIDSVGNAFPGGNGGFGGGGGNGGDSTGTSNTGGKGGNGGNGGFGGGGGVGGNGDTGGFGGPGGNGGNGGFGGGSGPGNIEGSPKGANGLGGFGGGGGSGFVGGGGAGMGGAIFNDAGMVTLTNVTLAENRASGGGFGASDPTHSPGSGYGGAIFNYAGFLTLSFVTVSNNMVATGSGGIGGSAQGGAIFSLSDTLANCSAGGNICTTGGAATLTISNTIAANSTGIAFDIVSHTSYADTSVYTPNATTLTGTVALGKLPSQLRGGLVDVMVPTGRSSAIDAGNVGPCAVTNDQRGVSRPQGAACDIGAVEIDTIFSGEFESIVQCSSMNKYTDLLIETFAGPTLSSDWTQYNGGAVTVSDGISLASTTTTFPYITSARPILPTADDFSVRWSATYSNFANQGTGTLVLSNGLPANGANDDYALRSADAWQDSTNGFTVRTRSAAATYNSVFTEKPAQNILHDVEYCWIGSQNVVEVWVDGTLLLQTRAAGLPLPTSLWFGNPAVPGGNSWSTFKLDHVYVRSVSP